jgi:hypothetical protein
MANHGDMASTCACHFGGFFGFLSRRIADMPDRDHHQQDADSDPHRQRCQ